MSHEQEDVEHITERPPSRFRFADVPPQEITTTPQLKPPPWRTLKGLAKPASGVKKSADKNAARSRARAARSSQESATVTEAPDSI